MNNIILYHGEDHDGQASGAIVQTYKGVNQNYTRLPQYPNIVDYDLIMVPMTRSSSGAIPWDYITPQSKVYVFDFNLDVPDWEKLLTIINPDDITWIDHHKINYESDYESVPALRDTLGVRDNQMSANGMVWEWFFPDRDMPIGLRLLTDYDNWNNEDLDYWENEVFPFENGMKTFDCCPIKYPEVWSSWLLEDFNNPVFLNTIKDYGNRLISFLNMDYAKNIASNSKPITYKDHSALILNSSYRGSELFGEMLDKYDIGIVYRILPDDKVSCSFYSTKIDISEFAKELGGGGHPGAAGCTISMDEFKNKILPL